MDLSAGQGQDPPEHSQRSDAAILRARGANFFDRRYVWPYRGLIVGTDPVAVDAIGAHLLQTKRTAHFGEDRALDVPPVHIEAAEKRYGLGVSDLKRIRLVKLGWTEEILI